MTHKKRDSLREAVLEKLKLADIGSKKTLAQHFLLSEKILNAVIERAHLHPGERILEIGPGPGQITHLLLQKGAYVTAIEIDERFARVIEPHPNLNLIIGDCLDVNFGELFQKPLRVIANIPYHITQSILLLFLDYIELFAEAFLIVDINIAAKLTEPGVLPSAGVAKFLSFYSVRRALKIPRGAFVPAPKIDSALIVCTKIGQELVPCEEFSAFVEALFFSKRKKAITNLKRIYPLEQLEVCFKRLQIDTSIRPQSLATRSIKSLFSLLRK